MNFASYREGIFAPQTLRYFIGIMHSLLKRKAINQIIGIDLGNFEN